MPLEFTLTQWLEHLAQLHHKDIDLGLKRVEAVYKSLLLDFSASRLVLIGGTNGKGTSCRLMQQLLSAHGYRVGCYNSPHIHDYRERVTEDGRWFSEAEHCAAFQKVEIARGDLPLTYFEFSTLAALVMLAESQPDYILLEVGLGGRLDATNIVTPDLSVITTIALDHQDWLGQTRSLIAIEKAGILRPSAHAVCGDYAPPKTFIEIAQQQNAKIKYQNSDFSFTRDQDTWHWSGQHKWQNLPLPNMPLQNASTVLASMESLNVELESKKLHSVLRQFQMPGRWQKCHAQPDVYVDVAHNPEAIEYLVSRLKTKQVNGKKLAVLGMLHDKDIKNCIALLTAAFDGFYLADINQPRGAKASELATYLPQNKIIAQFSSLKNAYQSALKEADTNDLLVALGSFWVVSEVLE